MCRGVPRGGAVGDCSTVTRTAAEKRRIYGTKERIAWFKTLPCVICGTPGPCDMAHSVSGGMGRKADYTTLVPLCGVCHREQHQMGTKSFEARYGVSLTDRAAQIQQAWIRREEG